MSTRELENSISAMLCNIDNDNFINDQIMNDLIQGTILGLVKDCIINQKAINLKNLLYYVTWEDPTCNIENEITIFFDGYDFSRLITVVNPITSNVDISCKTQGFEVVYNSSLKCWEALK